MAGNPYKPTSGTDVPLNGVDEHGGDGGANAQTNKTPNVGDDEKYSDASLPKGVNEYGATEDLGEQGDAADKYGTKSVPGMS